MVVIVCVVVCLCLLCFCFYCFLDVFHFLLKMLDFESEFFVFKMDYFGNGCDRSLFFCVAVF
jgi:hypothetical protein